MTETSFPTMATTAFIAAYLIGSLPFGWTVARFVAGIDIRQHGSGNIGATNVGRILGAKYFALVLVLDCLKGALPTALLPLWLSPADPIERDLRVLTGVAAIIGHMFPCWLGFRGGKGVATALGVVLVIAPVASLVAFLVWVACLGLSRIISLSSIVAACAFCGVELWQLGPNPFVAASWSLATFSTAVPLLIVVRHRANLARLMRGEEPRFKFGQLRREKGEPPAQEPSGEPLSGGGGSGQVSHRPADK